MNKILITSNYLDSLKAMDRKLGIVGGSNLDRSKIFNVLDDRYRISFAQIFLGRSDFDSKYFGWILVEEKIKALTEIVAYMLSDKNPRGVGSMSNNGNGKTDPTLRTIGVYPKKKIEITNEARFAYPEIDEDVKILKKIYKKHRFSDEYGLTRNRIIEKLRSKAKSNQDTGNHLVKAISDLKSGVFNESTPLSNQYRKALNARLPITEIKPNSPIEFKTDEILNAKFQKEEIIAEFIELQKLASRETALGLRKFLMRVFDFLENESGLNLVIKRSFDVLDKYLAEDIDSHSFYEYGYLKRVKIFDKSSFNKFEEQKYAHTLREDYGITRPYKFCEITKCKNSPVFLSRGSNSL